MEPGIVIVVMIIFAIVIRLFAGGADDSRLKDYIEERGGRLISSNWAPFGKGWFGEENDRIYEMGYDDKDDNEHEASCKTSMLTRN